VADNVNTMTQRLLVDAGIVTGIRVVDIGCGNGEVSLLLAKLVGKSGEVIGLDHDDKSLAAARERVHSQNFPNVTFIKCDLSGPLPQLEPFDAVVGRRVLMYLPNPVDTIRRITAALRPGGLAVFQESDSTLVPGRRVPMPLHEQVSRWIWQTVEREGGDIHIGFALKSLLEQSGLIVEHVRAEAVIQGQNTHYPLAFIVRAMLPRIIQHGVANEAEIDIETLEQRLTSEHMATNSIYVSDIAFGAFARKPF